MLVREFYFFVKKATGAPRFGVLLLVSDNADLSGKVAGHVHERLGLGGGRGVDDYGTAAVATLANAEVEGDLTQERHT